MRKTRNQKGFTIMELMIVIIIIGILIAIAVPAYNGFRARAQLGACQANRRTVKSAWGLFIADGGTDAAMDLAAMTTALVGATKYIDAIPTCPSGGVLSIKIGGDVACTIHTTDI